MTTRQIARLRFGNRNEAAKKRLLKLKSAGYIAERPRSPFDPAVLFLTRKSIRLLDSRGILFDYPPFSIPALERRARASQLTLRHELSIIDIKAAMFHEASATSEILMPTFSTWPLLNAFTVGGATIKPDGFMHLVGTNAKGVTVDHFHFLEVDRSTEALESLIFRAHSYLAYYQSGGFAERNQAPRSALKEFPFRVLMVFNTAERLNNFAERLLQASSPILTLVWLTTLAEALKSPLGPIWARPLDYRIATKGSRFDPATKPPARKYARDMSRDSFVAAHIKKHPLIGTE